jgi:hypothetical protein
VQTSFTVGIRNVNITVGANDVTEEDTALLIGPIFLNLRQIDE